MLDQTRDCVRGVWCWWKSSFNCTNKIIEYVNISTGGNAVDFGDLTAR